jgi:Tol biopolymer transport system component
MTRHAPLCAAVLCAGALTPAVPPALAAFPGDNGKILFESPRGGDLDVLAMGAGGGTPANLTADSAANDGSASWSPDGRRIAFMSDRVTERNPDPKGKAGPDFEIFVARADGSQPTQITFNGLDDEDPAWSPDGTRIVFSRDLAPKRGKVDYDLLTIGADGSGERTVSDAPGDDFQPSWSAKDRIAFVSDRDGDADVYTVSPGGEGLRKVTRNGLNDEFPNWSPDGKSLAFHRERDGNFDVYAMRASGDGVRRLTRNPAPEGFPAWSPDGRRIAFTRYGEKKPNVFTIRARGGGEKKLTGVDSSLPDWQAR